MSTVKSKKLQVGTDATSTNNFTIYQPASPDGTLRVGVGNADSPTEVGRFNSNGYKPVQPVAFIAYNTGGLQTVSNATWTKIEFDSTQHDTNSNFDTTNDRFKPTVAGYYQIAAHISSLQFSAASNNNVMSLWKNNIESYRLDGGYQASGAFMYAGGSSLVYLNGSTDYVDLRLYQQSGSNVSIQNGGTHVRRMSGILIAQA